MYIGGGLLGRSYKQYKCFGRDRYGNGSYSTAYETPIGTMVYYPEGYFKNRLLMPNLEMYVGCFKDVIICGDLVYLIDSSVDYTKVYLVTSDYKLHKIITTEQYVTTPDLDIMSVNEFSAFSLNFDGGDMTSFLNGCRKKICDEQSDIHLKCVVKGIDESYCLLVGRIWTNEEDIRDAAYILQFKGLNVVSKRFECCFDQVDSMVIDDNTLLLINEKECKIVSEIETGIFDEVKCNE